VIEAEVTVAPEPAESKLDQVNNLLAGVTDTPQEQAKTESPQVPEPAPPVVVEVDDFF
tara:strand:+ start:315 stop:488 length:174 start_codon:yes stop_codon:yes gene_type:complete